METPPWQEPPSDPLRLIGVRSTRAIVDLDAIDTNVRVVQQTLTPGTSIIAVVKANGYGHGAAFTGKAALAAGAAMLAVATSSEGVVLRRNGVRAPILVLGPVDQSQVLPAIEHSLTLAVNTVELAARINELAEESGRTAHVHLKIDTGMHRYGCLPGESVTIASSVVGMRHLWLEGVFTHFACADEPDESPTSEQVAIFDACLADIAAANIPIQIRHVANSAATLRSRRYDYDAVRLGIALYGHAPSSEVNLLPGMKPALRLISRITRVSELEPGDRVSYGGTYVAMEAERIALIPCGYADGYRRSLSNDGWAAIGDVRLPVRGRVCMDQMIVGIPDGVDVNTGDDVTLIGRGDDAAPTADDLASHLGTINYEIVTSIAARVPRLYSKSGHIVGIDDVTGAIDLSTSTHQQRSR